MTSKEKLPIETLLDRIEKIDEFISENWKPQKERLSMKKEEPDLTYLPCYYEVLFNLNNLCGERNRNGNELAINIFPYIKSEIDNECQKESFNIQNIMNAFVFSKKKEKNIYNTFRAFRDFYSCVRISSKNPTHINLLEDFLHNFNPDTFFNFQNSNEPSRKIVNGVSIALIALTRCLKIEKYQNKLKRPIIDGIELMLNKRKAESSSVFLNNLVLLAELEGKKTVIDSQILIEIEKSIEETYKEVKDIIQKYN